MSAGFVLMLDGRPAGRFHCLHSARVRGSAAVALAWAAGVACQAYAYRVGVPGVIWSAGCAGRSPVNSVTGSPRS